MKLCSLICVSALAVAGFGPPSQGTPSLIAIGSLNDTTDLSGLSGTLENGNPASVLGGIGSGLTWAGGSTFLALPDRGPNAVAWGDANQVVDNTTSYISRFQTVTLGLTNTPSGSLPFTLTPTLTGTTLLSSSTALNYAAANAQNGNIVGAPSINTANQFYFTGRSDNFGAGISLNPNNGRFDPEGIRVSNDGTKVYVSDEYGPYVYEFDRSTGVRTRTFTLPSYYGISTLSSQGATEISANGTGRVANKGMEGLAISPDGTTLYGFMQSPLAQDGGDGGRMNRIVKIDIATGAVHEYAYDNRIGSSNRNSSEILAINSHELLVLERDGKGLGDGSTAAVKQLWKVDLNGAAEIGAGVSGESALLSLAPSKTLFLDLRAVLNANGITDGNIPAKLEGASWGEDVTISGTNYHTLYIANDNDFIPTQTATPAGPNKFYVFAVSDADLGGSVFQNQSVAAVPEPGTAMCVISGIATLLAFRRGRRVVS